MNDPRVVSLRYCVKTSNSVFFEADSLLKGEINGFRFRIENDSLEVVPTNPISSEEEARSILEELLTAWEIDIALKYGEREFYFEFVSAKIIDQNPPPPGTPQTVEAKAALLGVSALKAKPSVSRKAYHPPPELFRLTPDVDTLWHRFERYKLGKEPLQSMSYFCITLLEGIFKNRELAADSIDISSKVLNTLAGLSTNKGSLISIRKYPKFGSPLPLNLSSTEVAWIEAVIIAIIRRMGEINQSSSLHFITMVDFPKLDKCS